MELIEYPDREMLAMGLADRLAGALRACLARHDRASFCVPGGSSPGETFATLAGTPLDWDRVDVLLGDERWVAPDDPRSNTRLLRETLLTDRAAAAQVIPMLAEDDDPEAGAARLAPGVEPALPLSLLLLGMGADGHTASLFPDDPHLARALAPDAPTVLAVRTPSQPEPRVTLSARVLRDAMETHLLIMGDEKRAVLADAREASPEEMPVAAVLRDATVHWAP